VLEAAAEVITLVHQVQLIILVEEEVAGAYLTARTKLHLQIFQ
jgi:hypothetical protein